MDGALALLELWSGGSCCCDYSEPAECSARAGGDAVRLALTIRALAHSMPGAPRPPSSSAGRPLKRGGESFVVMCSAT